MAGKEPRSPDSYRNDELVTYEEANVSTKLQPYIASVFSNGSDMFVLGNGENTSLPKIATSEFFNGPLEGGSRYSIFQRIFLDDKVSAWLQIH